MTVSKISAYVGVYTESFSSEKESGRYPQGLFRKGLLVDQRPAADPASVMNGANKNLQSCRSKVLGNYPESQKK
ncbi:hypothetical protein M0D69_06290 [Caballeronia sp. SEWSISQ10-4 2]|uniref:hypothetical protein n=1 Tax=Caballeronia sp. SEWSISQ10-4 2 TaxID=2937438 RepID=UPI002655B6D3|nr:hypothetical protein [Caballeronia sp. SEWSISQ10-4 2]MDN7177633.1 hypothetical protein [Caballeronia sp. SEWSISQ10-4 2]